MAVVDYAIVVQPRMQMRSCLSRDGHWFAGVVDRPDLAHGPPDAYVWAGARIVVFDVRTGDALPVATGGDEWSPAWSSDSDCLVFLRDDGDGAELWRWRPGAGASRVCETTMAQGLFSEDAPQWFPDGRRVLVSTPRRTDDRLPHDGADVRVDVLVNDPALGHNPVVAGFSPEQRAIDLAVVDVRRGAVRRIPVLGEFETATLSPDGQRVALQSFLRHAGPEALAMVDVALLEIEQPGPPAVLAQDLIADDHVGRHLPAWSPDGTRLARVLPGGVHVHEPPGLPMELPSPVTLWHGFLLWIPDGSGVIAMDTTRQLWRFPVTGAPVMLDNVGSTPFSPAARSVAAVRQGALLAFHPDDEDPPGSVLNHIPLGGGRSVRTTRQAGHAEVAGASLIDGSVGDVTHDAEVVVYTLGRANGPSQYWVRSGDDPPRLLSELNPRLSMPDLHYETIPFSYPAARGHLGAHLLAPVNPSEPPPVVVSLYPGARPSASPATWDTWDLGVVHAVSLVEAGYCVLVADLPAEHFGLPDSAESVVSASCAAVDAASERGLCDPTRIALVGHSGGGQAVTLALTATDRVAAGIAWAGVNNLSSWFGSLRIVGPGVIDLPSRGLARRAGGPPWSDTHRHDLSVVLLADRIATPLLLVHGAADSRVPVQQSDELFVALTHLDQPVTYLRYREEDHGSFSAESRRHVSDWTMTFLEGHLRTRKDATSEAVAFEPMPDVVFSLRVDDFDEY